MTTDQFGVGGQVALVTGASSGIGRAIAERFAADGASVVVCSREQANVDPVAEAINDRDGGSGRGGDAGDGGGDGDGDGDNGGRAVAVECDVRDREAVEALVETTVTEFGGLDCLVNNAGASFMANFEAISENGWKTIVDSNLHGTYHCAQAAGAVMREAGGGGTIINFASVAGQQGAPYMSHYAAAKAGIISLTSTLGFEWAEHGIRVNCIAPGFVATPGVESQMGVTAGEIDRNEIDRRIGTSEEIADVAQFLASPASSYITGETLTARGVPDIMETPE